MSFANRLKERREALGLNQSELGALLGVKGSAISNYENGVSSPKADILYKVFDVLKCDANFLFQDEMENKKGPTISGEAMKLARDYDRLDPSNQAVIRVTVDKMLENSQKAVLEKNTASG